ncbi:MAG TPA: phosphotransferase [Haloplasmataceae bacterium]
MEKNIKELITQDCISKVKELYGIEQVIEIGGFENFILGYHKDNENYILRITHSSHRNLEQVQAEIDWINFLDNKGISVSKPIKSCNGHYVEKINLNDSYFIVTSFIKAKGNHITRNDFNDSLLENYGAIIGKMHRVTKEYQDEKKRRYRFDEEPIIVMAKEITKDDKFLTKLNDLVQYLQSLPIDKDSFGLIHNDVHIGNFFVENHDLTIFDFDDCIYTHFISDIAIALFYHIMFIKNEEERKKRAISFLKPFMNGYKKENYLAPYWLKQLPYFLKLREYILYLVINRDLDVKTSKFGEFFLDIYQQRINEDIPFVDLDFTEVCK